MTSLSNHLRKTCSVSSFRLHVCEVFVELPELLHGRSEGHYLTAGIQRTLQLHHLHDGYRRLCRENVTINNELLKLCLPVAFTNIACVYQRKRNSSFSYCLFLPTSLRLSGLFLASGGCQTCSYPGYRITDLTILLTSMKPFQVKMNFLEVQSLTILLTHEHI